jgi:hypothetical protein
LEAGIYGKKIGGKAKERKKGWQEGIAKESKCKAKKRKAAQ